MRFQEVFKRLNGREATAEDVLKFERLTTALETTPGDAMLAVLVALDHYETLYGTIPKRITDTAANTLTSFKEAANAQATASMEKAKEELAKTVSEVAVKVASNTATKRMWQWAAGCIAVAFLCVGLFGWYMHSEGSTSGYSLGYGTGYNEAKDEKAAAAWANTQEGRLAYRFAQSGELQRLARCNGKGWKVEKGVCYPMQNSDGNVYGWALP
ncbi:DUF6753 family protein [Enterobacter roggenkampii]|uniref:DUF6753 family protein n=1 Tax=Enterobacter roggenkampii TaxID=1812935 RepID=UPI00202CAB2E|nr:DUF6753 family protein [Enterobacter roggenkampii]URR10760.1 protein mobE [Enterobacter roggenkampii]